MTKWSVTRRRLSAEGRKVKANYYFINAFDSFKKESSIKPSSIFIQYSMEYSELSMRILQDNGNYGDKSIVNTEYRV